MLIRLTHNEPEEIGARRGETMRSYVARLSVCPMCSSPQGIPCQTRSGRNHTKRVHAAILRELNLLKEHRTMPDTEIK